MLAFQNHKWPVTGGGGGVDTPDIIMGSNVISWFDANTSTLWQDASKTTAADTAADPVYVVVDEEGGDITTDDNARRPILRNDGTYNYLEMDDAHLSRTITGTTSMYVIVALEIPTTASAGLENILVLPDSTTWWQGDAFILEHNGGINWAQARVSNGEEAYTSNSPNIDTLGVIILEAIFDGTTNLEIALDGFTSTSPVGSATPSAAENAPNRYDLGRSIDGNAWTSDNGLDMNVYSMAICNRIPTAGERSDLRDWAASTNGVTL